MNYSKRLLILVAAFLLSIVTLLADLFLQSSGAKQLNSGIAFGVSFDLPNSVFVLLNILVLAGLIYFLKNKFQAFSPGQLFGVVLIISGGVSNLIDRVLYSGVIDYIELIGIYFNLADLLINLGLFCIILSLLIQFHNEKNNSKEAE